MFFLLYGETNSTKAKGVNRDVIERYDTHKGDIRKIRKLGSWVKWRMESTTGLVPSKTLYSIHKSEYVKYHMVELRREMKTWFFFTVVLTAYAAVKFKPDRKI